MTPLLARSRKMDATLSTAKKMSQLFLRHAAPTQATARLKSWNVSASAKPSVGRSTTPAPPRKSSMPPTWSPVCQP